jgi:hypothetical protein
MPNLTRTAVGWSASLGWLIHGERSLVSAARRRSDKRHRSIEDIGQRRGEDVSNVAAANKSAQIALGLLTMSLFRD